MFNQQIKEIDSSRLILKIYELKREGKLKYITSSEEKKQRDRLSKKIKLFIYKIL